MAEQREEESILSFQIQQSLQAGEIRNLEEWIPNQNIIDYTEKISLTLNLFWNPTKESP